MSNNKHTITAIATPDGLGALAVIRISGTESYRVFKDCIKEKNRFEKSKPKNIVLYTFIQDGKVVDEITAIKYCNPKSFTGEDMIEIICHGGKITVNEIIKGLIKHGARIADRGEFTRRAFESGKIDLYKAEAIRGIIESTSVIENRNALNAYYGSSLKSIEIIKEEIIEILCNIESEIEFAEEDDIKEKNNDKSKIEIVIKKIEKELKKREKIKEVGKGIKIVIAGPPNAGKSTLYNKILGYSRSIINEEAGTTRDLITEKIEVNNKTITIIDSAGIRVTENVIEREGIKKSEEAISESSIILWITSANENVYDEEKKKIEEIKNKNTLFIINKSDTNCKNKEDFFTKENIGYIKVSLKNDSIENIEEEIVKMVDIIKNSIELNEYVINERHEQILESINKLLKNVIEKWNQKEIAVIFLNDALKEIENLTGKINSEEMLNMIFSKFCIGK